MENINNNNKRKTRNIIRNERKIRIFKNNQGRRCRENKKQKKEENTIKWGEKGKSSQNGFQCKDQGMYQYNDIVLTKPDRRASKPDRLRTTPGVAHTNRLIYQTSTCCGTHLISVW